jgi:hypothetical protein
MNKKAQQEDIIKVIFFLVVFIPLMSGILIALNNIGCDKEIKERDACCSNADYWKGQYNAMNESIANCSNLIQEQIDNCDNRINESVSDCTTTLELYQNYVVVNKIFFAVYHILVIFLYIPLTINLFKITFEIGLGEKWDKLKKWYKRTLLITKIAVWIILTLMFIGYILLFLFSNPI